MVRSYIWGFQIRVCQSCKRSPAMNDFGKDHGLIHEAVVTGRGVGAGQDFWASLAHSKMLFGEVVAFAATMPIFRLAQGFDSDMANDSWELLFDSRLKEGEFMPELVELGREDCVDGDEMVKRTEQENCGGQRAVEAMLRDQDKIPQEWRKYVLVFPATIWRDRLGVRSVASLFWGGFRWCLDFIWLGSGFYRHYRVVRFGKYQK